MVKVIFCKGDVYKGFTPPYYTFELPGAHAIEKGYHPRPADAIHND